MRRSVDPVDLPSLLLTPLALLLNECVTARSNTDFPGERQGVVTVRLEARSEEQGARRLTIAAGGSSFARGLRARVRARAQASRS